MPPSAIPGVDKDFPGFCWQYPHSLTTLGLLLGIKGRYQFWRVADIRRSVAICEANIAALWASPVADAGFRRPAASEHRGCSRGHANEPD